MASLTLPQLVEAIATAVIQAQDRIDEHQLALLQRYFDSDDRPRSATMVVPSMSPDDDGDVRINIPWLALMRPNLLSIEEVQVDFEVQLTDFQTSANMLESKNNGEKKFPRLETSGDMIVQVAVPKSNDSGALAKVSLKVGGQEPSEGLARIINELVKRIMIIKT